METRLLGLIASVALLGATVAANASSYVVTLEEVGSDVVATGTGQIDLTGLSNSSSPQTVAGMNPSYALVRIGTGGDIYSGVSGGAV